jgi:cytochrome bd-type quinol oxidase subunit 2
VEELWLIIHYAGIIGFVAAHGAQMWMMMALKSAAPNRERMFELAEISRTATPPMYVALAILVIGGVGAGVQESLFNDGWWLWSAIAILLIEIGLMAAIATPYMRRIREATTRWADGSYTVPEVEFEALIAGPQTSVVMTTGVAGLAMILWLMVYKPGA